MQEKLELFGKEIPLRTHTCALSGKTGKEIDTPYINLYVRTKDCNSRCKFCIYHSDANVFNEKKYIEVIKELASKIEIRKFALSGGEPTLYWNQFKNIISICKNISPKTFLSLNTNGLRLDRIYSEDVHKNLDWIQISRHHWDDKINDEIFDSKTPTGDEIKEIVKLSTHDHQLHFRCNLIKGYVDSKESVFQFLDWTNSLGINDVGLVSLMPVNDYSKENYIYFHIKDLIGPNFLLNKKREYKNACECFNYIYLPEENFRNPMKIYHKNTYLPSEVQETLSFDGENLRLGFDGEIIY